MRWSGNILHWLTGSIIFSIFWPGLAKETGDICTWLGVESVHATLLDNQNYRKLVTEACHSLNEQRLRKASTGKEKLKRIESESYGRKEYFGKKRIEHVRIQFKARFRMLPFAGNFGRDRKFSHSEWLCKCKEEKELESHLLAGKCKIYGEIREKYGDLEDDDDLVEFFNEVLERREELEESQELEVETTRGLEDEETLVVGQNTADDASPGLCPEHASLGTLCSSDCTHH